MNKKADFESQHQDPYEVIRRLRGLLESQQSQLEEYQMVCDSLVFEKNAAVKQSTDLKREVSYLTQRLQQQRLGKSRTNSGPLDLFQTRVFSKQNRLNYTTLSPQLVKSDIATSHIIYLNSTPDGHAKKATKSKEFIPSEIVFKNKEQTKHIHKSNLSAESSSESILENVGESLIEDFIVISPDILELKRLREHQKEQRELKIEEYYLFNYNTLYKNRKAQYLKEVAKRAFPLGAIARRRGIENYQQFKHDMEFDLSNKMGQQYFVFNLKGDFADSQKNKRFVGNCNPFQGLFAICLRVPDFIPIKEEKYNQKKQQQVWMVQKVYTILTYYPFFNIHLSILCKIHKILEPLWYKLQKDEILSKNLQRNLTQAQQNQEVNRLISFLMGKKPDLTKICLHQSSYFGTFPALGFSSEYCIARFCCGIFFSSFAYEQMLLLITAMLLQKTIILASKSQSAATLCALFLTTVIGPFKYNQHLILNCDKQKIDNILFQFPFILVASIKKDASFHNILKMFIDNNCDRFKGFSGKDQTAPLMLVDIDSNTIFYDPLLNKIFQQLIVSPSETLRQAYMQVNPSNSKSFTFPKKMPVEVVARPKNDFEKNQEERRKLQKQYQQKLDNNISKWPTYNSNESHFKVLSLITEYIQSFAINSDYHYELIVSTRQNRELRKEKARSHLLAKHPLKHKLVNVLMESQLYADYLDEIQKQIEGQD